MYDYLIVGAGLAGCTLAERIASQLDISVLVVEQRAHIGGNVFDHDDEHGIRIHEYGPHIFHTNKKRIVDYLSKFTAWRPYEHRVSAEVDGRRVSFPINRNTLNQLYGLGMSSEGETRSFLASQRVPVARPRNAEQYALSAVGHDLYEKFFRRYTEKQWGVPPAQLDPSVFARIPVRTDADERYFTDRYQMMPAEGYARMFKRMVSHRRIDVLLRTDYHDIAETVRFHNLIYTGPIDRFFDYQYGELPYRSLRFVHEYHPCPQVQEVGTVNYPNEHEFTRRTEWKHLTGQECTGTTVTYEYPTSPAERGKRLYYPIPTEESDALARRYRAKARTLKSVAFCGRLAQYRYYNMDQVVDSALRLFTRNIACTKQPSAHDPESHRPALGSD